MQKQTSTGLFILGGALILALGLFFVGYFMFRSTQSPYGMANSISVMGEGKASVKPDMLVINISVSELADTTAKAQTQSNEKINEVKQLFSGLNLPEQNLKTTAVNVYPEYDRNDASGRKLLGYRSQQSLSISVTGENFAEIGGNIVTDISKIGGVNVDGTYFDLKDRNGATSGARQKALDDAKTKALQLAKASGVKLGRAINITDNTYSNIPGPIYYAKAEGVGMAMDTATVSNSLSPGETEVTVNVNVVYKIR